MQRDENSPMERGKGGSLAQGGRAEQAASKHRRELFFAIGSPAPLCWPGLSHSSWSTLRGSHTHCRRQLRSVALKSVEVDREKDRSRAKEEAKDGGSLSTSTETALSLFPPSLALFPRSCCPRLVCGKKASRCVRSNGTPRERRVRGASSFLLPSFFSTSLFFFFFFFSLTSSPSSRALSLLHPSPTHARKHPRPPPTLPQTLFRDSPDVKEFLTNPCVSGPKKKELLKRLGAEAGLDPSTLNFLGLLVDNDRLVAADEVFVAFEKLYCGLTDTQVAVVRSAVKLEQEQQFLIAKKLQELTGSKNIKLKPEVDASLIAGFVVEYGSSQVDLSVKGQLDKITTELTTAQV